MGAMELQIFVSLLVVLGAAFVALICDFLKGNNEKLREVNIELLVRQEERERAEVGRDRVRRVKPAAEMTMPGLAARVAEAERVKEPAVAPPMSLPEGVPGYPRRRRAGRGADSGMRPEAVSARHPEQPVERPTAIEVMEDWARKVVERGAAGRVAEQARFEPVPRPVETAPVPVETAPIMVQVVPELTTREVLPAELEPAAPQALHQIAAVDPVQARFAQAPVGVEPVFAVVESGASGESDLAAPLIGESTATLSMGEVAGVERLPAAPQSLQDIVGASPMQLRTAPAPAAVEAVFAVVEQGWARDVSEAGFSARPAGELGTELAMGGLAAIETRPAAQPAVVQAIEAGPVTADYESGTPVADGKTAEAQLPVMAELLGLPATVEGVSRTWSEVAVETVPILGVAAEPGFQAKFDVQLLPPDWASTEVEQAMLEEAAEIAEMPEFEFAAATLEQFRPEEDQTFAMVAGESETFFAESAEPRAEEIVRVRVLDEGDLIELSQPVEMSVEPVAAAQIVEPLTGDVAPVRFAAEDQEEPVIGCLKVLLEAVDIEQEEPELVAEVECEQLAEAAVTFPVEPWADEVPLVLDDIEVEDLPDRGELQFAFTGGEIEQEPEMVAPQAPLVLEVIEPVQSEMERFVDMDSSLELNPKVVQMPAPVQNAQASFPKPAPIRIPSGIQDRQMLADLVEQDAAFDGVVFFVGLLGYEHLIADHGQPAVRQAVAAANGYFNSLLGESGFGCWAEESLFVMVVPAESMEVARQLSQQTAEGLWDYQLRSLGSLPIIFHWGSFEAAGEPLSMALQSANEQMIESGRARKQVLSTSGRFRRRVANG